MVRVLPRADRDVGDDAVVAGAAAENGKEQIPVGLHRAVNGDCLIGAVGQEYLEGHDLIAEQAEGAGQLAVPSGLDMTADVHVEALAGWHEQASFLQLGVELQQRIADAEAQQAGLCVVVPIRMLDQIQLVMIVESSPE